MKKLILLAALVTTTTTAFAQNADDMEKAALEACDTQAAAIPEAQRNMVLNMCKCSVENTDYDLMIKAQSDETAMKELQKAAMNASQKCAAAVAG